MKGIAAMIKNKKTFENALWVLLFAGLFYYNFCVHPQVILDYDDWSYVSYLRIPIPWPSFWNPSRVLPELLMPLAGFAGSLVYRLFPSLGYIMAETLVFSVIITAFEFLYVFLTARFIVRHFSLSSCYGVPVAVMFLLMHFWAFRTELIGNEYLLRTTNLTCCFFYLIPVLLNYILFFILENNRELLINFFSADNWKKKFIILILLYFTVFSNLFANVVIAVYAFIRIIVSLFSCKKTENNRFNVFVKENSVYFFILIMWLVSLAFDAFGGRAKVSYGTVDSYSQALFKTDGLKLIIGKFGNALDSMNKYFALFSILMLIVAGITLLFSFIKKREGFRHEMEVAFILMISQVLITVYILLLCMMVSQRYIFRSDVLITVFGSFFIILCVAVVYVSTKLKAGVWPVIAICIIAAVMSNTPGYTFKDSYSIDITLSPEKCIAVSQDLVDQVIAAEANGQSEMDLYVMLTIDMGCQNWPQCSYMQDVFKTTMVRHGIMKGDIAINSVIPSEDFNQKYNLDFSEMLLLGK